MRETRNILLIFFFNLTFLIRKLKSWMKISAVVPENTKKLCKLVLADRKLKLREIAEELKISESSIFIILHEHLSMRKLYSKWVPRLFTVDQNKNVLTIQSIVCNCFNATKCFCINMTMDETWIHQFTPESNRQSAEWTAAGENCP